MGLREKPIQLIGPPFGYLGPPIAGSAVEEPGYQAPDPSPGGSGLPATAVSGFDFSGLFSGGNNTLLLIGAAIVAWMIFGKKR